MSELSGHCLCGAVTYTASAEPVAVVNCHCTDCQHQSGAAFSTNVAVPRDAFEVSGETLSEFETIGTDTKMPVRRLFCSRCGSPVASLPEYLPDLAIIKAGTLDDSTAVKPAIDAWTGSAQPWVDLEGTDRRQLERGPS